jgi:hypothetical protein
MKIFDCVYGYGVLRDCVQQIFGYNSFDKGGTGMRRIRNFTNALLIRRATSRQKTVQDWLIEFPGPLNEGFFIMRSVRDKSGVFLIWI